MDTTTRAALADEMANAEVKIDSIRRALHRLDEPTETLRTMLRDAANTLNATRALLTKEN